MRKLLVVIGMAFSINGFAQSKEFLIKNNGDTVWGSHIRLEDKTFFYSDDAGQKQEIASGMIKEIKSRAYKGTVVVNCVLYLYSDNLLDLQKNYMANPKSDTAMILTQEYSGPKMNLYMGKDTWNSIYYFYKTPDDPQPVQLVVRYALGGSITSGLMARRDETDTHIVESKGYVNQLRAIMADCSKFNEATWESLTYRIYSLKWVIKKFNSCK